MKLLGNFLSLAGAELLSKLATILAFAHLARVAGPVGYGYVEFAGAVLLCAALLVDQGFGYYGAREIARDKSRRAALVGEIIFLRLALSLVAAAVMVALAFTLDRGAVQRNLLLVYALCLPALAFQLQWIFQGYERMSSVAAIQLTRQGIFAAVVLFALHSSSDLVIAGLAEVLGALAAGVLGVWMYRAQFGAWITVVPRVAARTLREQANRKRRRGKATRSLFPADSLQWRDSQR